MIPGIGPMELFILVVLALVIFGPQKLPEMGKSIGKTIREFKSAGDEIKQEITKVTEEINIKPDLTINPQNQSRPVETKPDVEIQQDITDITDEIESVPEKTNNSQNQSKP